MQIKDEATLRAFIHEVDGLHDALLHEAILLHPGYVTRDGRMFGDTELPDAKLLFQSQFSDVALVEVTLKGVSKFQLQPQYDFSLDGEIDRGEVVLYLYGKQQVDRCELRSKHAEYRLLGTEHLGSEYMFVRAGVLG